MNHLQPGDQILADRGFTVQDSMGLYCAEVTFTKGKKQLSRLESDTARQLSHVESYWVSKIEVHYFRVNTTH